MWVQLAVGFVPDKEERREADLAKVGNAILKDIDKLGTLK